MKVNFYLTHNDPIHDWVVRSLYQGCPEDKELRYVADYEPADVSVVFGVEKKAVEFSKHRGRVIRESERTIVLETGYIKRGRGEENYFAAGWNGLNGKADFNNFNSPSDRWEKLGVELKPWQEGSIILLCGQVPWDASVDHTNHLQWLEYKAKEIKNWTDKPVVFRPHPVGPDIEIFGTVKSLNKSLLKDFEYAHAVVTYNSNTGVDGALNGVPVFADHEGSMVWSIANRNLVNINDPLTPDREQWAFDIAYTQWTPEEMRSGEVWEHLTG